MQYVRVIYMTLYTSLLVEGAECSKSSYSTSLFVK